MCILVFYMCIAALSITRCDARRSMKSFEGSKSSGTSLIKHSKTSKVVEHLDVALSFDSSNTEPYGLSSPLSLPPFDSLGPISLPESTPPVCIYPPTTPQSPYITIPSPIEYTPSSPPPFITIPSPAEYTPSSPPPPFTTIPSPTEYTPSSPPLPPYFYIPPILPITQNPPPSPPESILSPPIFVPGPSDPVLGPPIYEPSPPSYIPSPSIGGFNPSPPVFQPPVVFPPPAVPPPPHKGQTFTLWCVAKPSVPDPIIEEAMNYACGSGADCGSIQPDGSCYEPNTLFAHASYAFNSYWQRTKAAGGTCDFGGTAILVTVDPSFDGCHFMYA